MKLKVYCKGHNFSYEAGNVARLFFEDVTVCEELPKVFKDEYVLSAAEINGLECMVTCEARLNGKLYFGEETDSLENETGERILGKAMYKALSEATGIKPPWGILTGIRPVKLIEANLNDPYGFYVNKSYTSEEKAKLAISTYENENRIISLSTPGSFSLYVGIPFCPSRCNYCSFVSKTVENAGKMVDEYVDKLVTEIEYTGREINKLNLNLESIYFGGGTPTVLSASQLDRIMKAVKNSFDLSNIREYTIEGGRPETITEEKLKVIFDNGADRLSINPQTMNDRVLELTGRRHTVLDVYKAYELARKFDFKTVNMDLIAGLAGDNVESFKRSVDAVIDLSPENITIHTLCIKRAAFINEDRPVLPSPSEIDEMLNYAQKRLTDEKYLPYYLYRQRNTLSNAENTGWSKNGNECLYNVYTMDQTHTIISCGGGGVTILREPNGNRIERIFNYKYPYEYLSRFDTLLERKKGIGEFYSQYSY